MMSLKGFATVSILAVSHTSANSISLRIYVSAKSVQVMQKADKESRAPVSATLFLLLPPTIVMIIMEM